MCRFLKLALLVTAAVTMAVPNMAWTETPYQNPDQVLADIVEAPQTPWVSLSPNEAIMLMMEPPSLPSVAELAERELRLAGMRIKPQINGQSRTRPLKSLSVLDIESREQRKILGIPEGARIENTSWSPKGDKVLFTNTTSTGLELWVAELDKAKARPLTGPVVSMTGNISPVWLSDNETIVFARVPQGPREEPKEKMVPDGPVTQENLGKVAPARTYQDLLKNPHDEELFEFYMAAQMCKVNMKGKVTAIGEEGLLWDFNPSPDGNYILVETIHKPFSYLVPASRFPQRVEIFDLDGNLVREIVDLPLQESVPIAFGSVTTGPRRFAWRNDAAAELVWAEALDGGDAGAEAELRDKVVALSAPFEGEPRELMKLSQRFGGITWGNDECALVYSWWWKTRNLKTWRLYPGGSSEPEVLSDRSWEDRYGDPGNPETKRNEYGRSVLAFSEDGKSLFFVGDGASEEGDRPFLDRYDLATKTTERLFRSDAPYYEEPIQVLGNGLDRVLTRRETVSEPPNYYLRNINTGDLTAITEFEHPTPQLLGIQKEQIRYKRKDGVELTGTLYLPAGYTKSDGPLPTVLWAYPQEFKSADAAGQVTDSPYRFDRVGWWSALLWLTQGYAVIDDPGMPIIGEGDVEPNETFVDQLVSSAEAVIDELVTRGVTDRGRVAVGGHSYGAFMTANLLAHSDLFAAGIARSGAYNRTLTPFGFQSEERTLWQASDIYFAMSPFMHAEKINEPILLIHGEADNNPGTYPMQSERFYSALKGLGATTRLVMLPHESHGYRAKESILHMLWETEQWLDKYVKNKHTPVASDSD